MIFEKVRQILMEQFDIEESKITMETNLYEDLSADSLDLADLLSTLEDEFDVEVTDDLINSIFTVEDLVKSISALTEISGDDMQEYSPEN